MLRRIPMLRRTLLPDVLDAGKDVDYRFLRKAFYSGFLPTDDQSNDGADPE